MDNDIPASPGSNITRRESVSYSRVDVYAYMSDNQAKAMIQVAKNQYAIPARHETIRFLGVLALVAILLVFLVPAFLSAHPTFETLAWLIGLIVVVLAGPS